MTRSTRQRATVALLTVLTSAGLALASAGSAAADAIKFNATPGQLQSACKKVGGEYFEDESNGHYYCATKNGMAGCNSTASCNYVPDPATRPTGPTVPQLVQPAGVA